MNDLFYYPEQTLNIEKFADCSRILDIGGGGEGIIGQLNPAEVVAVDSSEEELLEAAEGPLKIVMDARKLQFLDNTFPVVTAFYSMLYMSAADQQRVFEEVFRVLKYQGIFHIWDASIEKADRSVYPGFAVPVKIVMPGKTIISGYGAIWPLVNYTIEHYVNLAERTGFTVIEKTENNFSVYLKLTKLRST